MEFRDAFKESRGKRAAREKADEVPCTRNASQAADELSKACIVQVRRLRDGSLLARACVRLCAHARAWALAQPGLRGKPRLYKRQRVAKPSTL
jgi:hypothetical protein